MIGVTVCACLLVLWRSRPTSKIRIKLSAPGVTLVDDNEMESATLGVALEREVLSRKLWLVEPQFVVQADADITVKTVTETVELVRRVGGTKVIFEISD